MTSYEISQLSQLSALAAGDLAPVVDVSDTSTPPAGPGGSDKSVPAAQLGDQLSSLAKGTASNAGLTSLWAAIANRNSARCEIIVLGDSITEGQGASLWANRWVVQAQAAIRAAYPTTANGSGGGYGFIPIQSAGSDTFTWPVTQTAGAVTEFDLGPVRNSTVTSATGSTWTYTATPGTTSVKIMYYDVGYSGSFTYKVNSGSTTTVSNTMTGKELLTSSIPMVAGDVLTIVFTAGTGIVLDGLLHFAGDENSGITLHGCGHFGWCAGTEMSIGWNQPETYSLNWAQCYANGFPTTPAALMIMLGVNDARITSVGSGGGRTAAQFASDLQGLVSTIRGAATALATLPLILVIPYQANETVQDAGGWAAYAAAIRSVAVADAVGAMVIDLNYRMPTVASDYDGGILYIDDYHPTDLGHLLLGKLAAGAAEGLPPEAVTTPARWSAAEPLASGESILPRFALNGSLAYPAGTLALASWVAATSGTATAVRVATTGTAGSGLTYAAVGVYELDSSGNGQLLASTGDVHATAFTSAYTVYDLTLTSSFARNAGQRYALGMLFTGTTPPSVAAVGYPNYGFGSVAPWAWGGITGQSALPATFLASSLAYTDGPPAATVHP